MGIFPWVASSEVSVRVVDPSSSRTTATQGCCQASCARLRRAQWLRQGCREGHHPRLWSWCPPCQSALPQCSRIQDRQGAHASCRGHPHWAVPLLRKEGSAPFWQHTPPEVHARGYRDLQLRGSCRRPWCDCSLLRRLLHHH